MGRHLWKKAVGLVRRYLQRATVPSAVIEEQKSSERQDTHTGKVGGQTVLPPSE